MSVPFAPGPRRGGIFAEVVFGSLGIGVIATALAALSNASVPSAPSLTAPAAVAAAVWSDSEAVHLVDISHFAAAIARSEPTAEPLDEPEPEEEAPAPRGEAGTDAPERASRAQEQGAGTDEEPRVAAAEPEAGAPAKDARPAKKGRRCTTAADPGIVSTATGRWTVQQSVIRRYTRDWSRLDELGWSRAHKDAQGRSDGLEVGGIRCGSDVYDAGFRNGDVIHSVNGRKIRSLPQALLAYTALHNDASFAVEITRRGKRQILNYRLKD